jgi:release factor glutamine methyltransferase
VTVADMVELGAQRLTTRSDSPRLDAELLLGSVLGLTRGALLANSGGGVGEALRQRYLVLIARRGRGEPVAYLTGAREFWSLALSVSPAVLVPRPETELLVERALLARNAHAPCRVLDLGTGSGAIAIALATERPRWEVHAADLSEAALEVARANAAKLGCPSITFWQGDWFAPLGAKRFDLIVSNPPYVAAADPALSALCAEPMLALSPGRSGLEALARIAQDATLHLHAGGSLLLEHGADQSGAVQDLLQRQGFTDILTSHDLSGRPRVTQGALYQP